jgi:MinD-like ATPase involved in chromosome partitioning or flagellar assembly
MGYDPDRIVLVLNRADSRVGIDDDDVLAVVGKRPDVRIPSDVDIPRSVNEGRPIALAKPNSPVGKAFQVLAEEFLRREGHETVNSAEPEPRTGRGKKEKARETDSLPAVDGNSTQLDGASEEAPRRRLRLSARRR